MTRRLFLPGFVFAILLQAADVTGMWEATIDSPNGRGKRTFTFKMDGEKVTGSTESSFTGKSEISDGKLQGDTLTFTAATKFNDQEITLKFTGKIKGAAIDFHVETADGSYSTDYTAKKVS